MTYVIWILIIIILAVILIYNRLAALKNRVLESKSDIDVQLKRRYDLIPNLVETVKGYMTHEKNTLETLTKMRTEMMKSSSMQEKAEKDEKISENVKSLFAVAENYPDLKANQNFLALQDELTDTEDKLQAARRFYNMNVMAFNTTIHVFPHLLIAKLFSYNNYDFFEANEEDRSVPSTK